MDRFAYTKRDGTEDLLPKRSEPFSHLLPQQVPVELFAGGSAYEKTEGSIEPRLYFIISGGTTREKCFLQTLINNKDNVFHSLKLVFLTSVKKAGGLTPKMMALQWREIQKKGCISLQGRVYLLEDFDKVYMITDVDHYEDELRQILLSGSQPCEWVISNPDIEVWLYYCYFDNPKVDLESVRLAPLSRRPSQMKAMNAKLHPGGIDPRKAFFNMKRGIVNAKKCYEEDVAHFPALFSTQMWRLCEDIEGVMPEEFEKWRQAEIERIRRNRKQVREPKSTN